MKKLWLVPIAAVIKCEAKDIICFSVEESQNLDSYDGKTVNWSQLR